MTGYPVRIRSATEPVKAYQHKLRRYGLEKSGADCYTGTLYTKTTQRKLREFCAENGLRFSYDNGYSQRSSNYRQKFFANHPPDLGDKYICVYCGKRLTKEQMTVDHLYPVSRTAANRKLQNKLKRKGIENVNDLANLVAACSRCNRKKSNKMRKWIWKGKLGRHKRIWYLRWTLRWVLGISLTVLAVWIVFPSLRPVSADLWMREAFANVALWLRSIFASLM